MERKQETASLKKTYQMPKLQVYGCLTEMTKKGPSLMSDSGMNAMS